MTVKSMQKLFVYYARVAINYFGHKNSTTVVDTRTLRVRFDAAHVLGGNTGMVDREIPV